MLHLIGSVDMPICVALASESCLVAWRKSDQVTQELSATGVKHIGVTFFGVYYGLALGFSEL